MSRTLRDEPLDRNEVPQDDLAALRRENEALRTRLAEAEARLVELAQQAETDHLTGLLNRRGFLRAVERGLAFQQRHGGKAAMVFVDLDGFKAVNDMHGHPAGDEILRAVARVLRENCRTSDVVARLGGDEFALVLWRCDREAGAKKIAALAQRMVQPPDLSGAGIAASIGMVVLGGGESPEAALARADAEMYAQKRRREAKSPLRR